MSAAELLALEDVGVLTETRMGITWCLTHREPIEVCHCKAASHNWGQHNALRRYSGLVSSGKAHPFKQTGGQLVDFREGPKGVQLALSRATTERVPLHSLVATYAVNHEHVGRLIRGKADPPRSGNNPFELSDKSTVLRMGGHHLLLDGHHRSTSDWAAGKTHETMRVLSGLTPRFQNSSDFLLRP